MAAKRAKVEHKLELAKRIYKHTEQEESIIVQSKVNSQMLLQSLIEYRKRCWAEFEQDWVKFEKDLHKYELKRKEFSNFALQKSKYGTEYWLNLKTLEETSQHPGEQYSQINLKQMRKKAEAGFKTNVLDNIDKRIETWVDKVYEPYVMKFENQDQNQQIFARNYHLELCQMIKIKRIKYYLKQSKSFIK